MNKLETRMVRRIARIVLVIAGFAVLWAAPGRAGQAAGAVAHNQVDLVAADEEARIGGRQRIQ